MTDLRSELAVDQARSAAREGDFERALSLVDPESVEGLDLRARMHAQRGEFAAAGECWGKVSELSPEDPAAAAGLKALESLPARRRPALLVGSAAAVVLLLLVGSALWWWPSPEPVVEQPVAAPVVSAAPVTTATPSASPEPSSAPLGDLGRKLAVDGVAASVAGDSVRVVFDDGLFVSGDQLGAGARGALDRVGKALKGTDVTVTVVGHAVAVPGGRTAGGSRVALARAQVASSRLSAASGLPWTAFTLTSADQSDGPHRTAAENRTVTLLVTPAS